MSNNSDESPNFSINSTQNNTTENIIQAPNLINPITSSEPGFLINSTDANILNNLLGVNSMFPVNRTQSLNSGMRTPLTYTTSTTSDQNGISSLITISGNIFNDLSEIEDEDSDDDSIPELESPPAYENEELNENASGEADSSNNNITGQVRSLENLAMRIASRRRRRNSVHPRNMDLMRFFTNMLADDLEEQIVRQVMRESFNEDQEKRLIDVARELNIEKEKFDPNKESHKEFCSLNPDSDFIVLNIDKNLPVAQVKNCRQEFNIKKVHLS